MTQDEHERMLKKMGKSAWQLNGLVIYESMKVQWFIKLLGTITVKSVNQDASYQNKSTVARKVPYCTIKI